MAKATHWGTCQICARVQKAPNGYMAYHGYKVTYGFFTGTCRGSKELPYEVSRDVISEVIRDLYQQDYFLEGKVHEAIHTPTEVLAWALAKTDGQRFASWQQVEIKEDYSAGYPLYRPEGTRIFDVPWERSHGEAVRQGNQRYARHLNQKRAQIQHAIKELEARWDAWVEAELAPVVY